MNFYLSRERNCFLSIITVLFFGCVKTTIELPEAIDLDLYYSRHPNVGICDPGELKNSTKIAALARLNFVRKLHDLPEVTYNYEHDKYTQSAALISLANGGVTHNPASNLTCFSANAAYGCGHSNLLIGNQISTIEDNIDLWITEKNSSSIGHRRWMLDPFLKFVSYGRVDGVSPGNNIPVSYAALSVVNDEFADIKNLPIEFIAYPYRNYPKKLFLNDGFLSFSVLSNKVNRYLNVNVSFAVTKVSVLSEAGKQMTINSLSFDNDGYGIQNGIQWKVDILHHSEPPNLLQTEPVIPGKLSHPGGGLF